MMYNVLDVNHFFYDDKIAMWAAQTGPCERSEQDHITGIRSSCVMQGMSLRGSTIPSFWPATSLGEMLHKGRNTLAATNRYDPAQRERK